MVAVVGDPDLVPLRVNRNADRADDAGARAADETRRRGVTGAIGGEYPKSPWKIALLVLGALIVLWLVLSYGPR